MNLEQIERYVIENKLDSKTRKQEIADQRFFICAYVRTNFNVTLQYIADMMNFRGHDNVLHAIKRHEQYQNDSSYKEVNKKFMSLIRYGEDITKKDLRTELINAKGLIDFHRLQEQVKNGLI